VKKLIHKFGDNRRSYIKGWRCGGTVNRRTLICENCGIRPPAKEIELRKNVQEPERRFNPRRAYRQFEMAIFQGVSQDSLFRYPRQ
jgi:hypothetical protein